MRKFWELYENSKTILENFEKFWETPKNQNCQKKSEIPGSSVSNIFKTFPEIPWFPTNVTFITGKCKFEQSNFLAN